MRQRKFVIKDVEILDKIQKVRNKKSLNFLTNTKLKPNWTMIKSSYKCLRETNCTELRKKKMHWNLKCLS